MGSLRSLKIVGRYPEGDLYDVLPIIVQRELMIRDSGFLIETADISDNQYCALLTNRAGECVEFALALDTGLFEMVYMLRDEVQRAQVDGDGRVKGMIRAALREVIESGRGRVEWDRLGV